MNFNLDYETIISVLTEKIESLKSTIFMKDYEIEKLEEKIEELEEISKNGATKN